MIAIAAILALILLTLGVLLALTISNTRRLHRIMAQDDDVLAALAEVQPQLVAVQGQLSTLQSAQTAATTSLTSQIARVEALITALGNNADPKLEAAINSLHDLRDGLTGVATVLASATATAQAQQATADAERPDAPPPA